MSINPHSSNSNERRPRAELDEIIHQRWGIVYNFVDDTKRSAIRTFPVIGSVLPIVKPTVERLNPEVSASIISQAVHEADIADIVTQQLSSEQQARVDSALLAMKKVHDEIAA